MACRLRQGQEQQSKIFWGKSMAKSFLLSNEARQGFFQVRFLSLFVSFITIIYSLSASTYVIPARFDVYYTLSHLPAISS